MPGLGLRLQLAGESLAGGSLGTVEPNARKRSGPDQRHKTHTKLWPGTGHELESEPASNTPRLGLGLALGLGLGLGLGSGFGCCRLTLSADSHGC